MRLFKLTPLLLALAACANPAQPTTQVTPASRSNARILGTLEIGIDSNARTSSLQFRPQGTLAGSSPQFTFSSFAEYTTSGKRFLDTSYNIANTTGSGFANLTLYALNQGAQGIGGTAIKNLRAFDGSSITDAAIARTIKPAHATHIVSGAVVPDPDMADFQAFTAAEAAAIQTAAQASGAISGSDGVLEYGFVARNGTGRAFAANASGQVTLGLRIPSGLSPSPYRFTMTFLVVDEPVRRVTRSVEEFGTPAKRTDGTLVTAADRAAALGSSGTPAELVFVGPDGSDPAINPNFSFNRIANLKMGTAPTFLIDQEIPTCPSGTVSATIMQLQGTGLTTTSSGTQTVDGVVVADFQNVTGQRAKLNGFFIQSLNGDDNPATSDGVFVFAPTAPDVVLGDYVRVTGNVAEFSGATQLSGTIANPVTVIKCGTAALPAATPVNMPLTNPDDLERYEGMRIKFVNPLTVTEHFQLGRYGQVTLSSDGSSNQAGTDARLEQFTSFNAPSVAGNAAHLLELSKRRIVLDDVNTGQNLDPITFGRGGNPLTASNTLRGGDTVSSLEGILSQGCNAATCASSETAVYRVQPNASVNFAATNARPSSPTIGGSLRVASFNVLNFFNERDTIASTSSASTFNPPAKLPSGAACPAIEVRGAENFAAIPDEFPRQKDKTVQAILAINADVLGLIEMQNNGTGASSAIIDLVTAINAAAPGTSNDYAIVADPAQPEGSGCDAIKVAFIFKPATVVPVSSTLSNSTVAGITVASGAAYTVANNADPNGDGINAYDAFQRKPIAVSFKQLSNNAVFTAVMNHLKSKGSAASLAGDADSGDGQGQSNATRTAGAKDLTSWLTTKPTGTLDPDYVLLGDFNAYHKEDPLVALETAGFTNLLPISSYSYVFDGQWGSLDHGFGSASLSSQVAGAEKFHINADEPSVLDYNRNFKTSAQQIGLYAADPFRSSDHDPVLVGLNLNP